MNRRQALALTSAAGIGSLMAPAQAAPGAETGFLAEAFRLRDEATAAGDQPYGAVLVLDGRIIGQGRSRVVADGNSAHHAERIALWDGQKRLGRQDMTGAAIYSTSIPCAACQRALAGAGVSRMVHGRGSIDAGPPRIGS